MKLDKFLLAGVAGGVVLFLLGFLIWGVLLADFMKNNMGPVQNLDKVPMVWWAMVAGNLAIGFLLAYIYGQWANISTPITGLKAGAIIGALYATAVDLMLFSTTNMMNLTAVIVDIVANTVAFAIIGAVVAFVLGMGKAKG